MRGPPAALPTSGAADRALPDPYRGGLPSLLDMLNQTSGPVSAAFGGIASNVAAAKNALGGWWTETKAVYSEAEAAEEKRILKAKRTAEKAAEAKAAAAPEAFVGPPAPPVTPSLPERVSATQIEAEKDAAKEKEKADKKAATQAKRDAEKKAKDAERDKAKKAKDAEREKAKAAKDAERESAKKAKDAAKEAKTLPELVAAPEEPAPEELVPGRGPGPWLPDVVAPPAPTPPAPGVPRPAALPEIVAPAPRVAAAAEAGALGNVLVLVRFENAPPGMRVSTQTSGAVSARADVGYSMPQLAGGRMPGLLDVLRGVARVAAEAI